MGTPLETLLELEKLTEKLTKKYRPESPFPAEAFLPEHSVGVTPLYREDIDRFQEVFSPLWGELEACANVYELGELFTLKNETLRLSKNCTLFYERYGAYLEELSYGLLSVINFGNLSIAIADHFTSAAKDELALASVSLNDYLTLGPTEARVKTLILHSLALEHMLNELLANADGSRSLDIFPEELAAQAAELQAIILLEENLF